MPKYFGSFLLPVNAFSFCFRSFSCSGQYTIIARVSSLSLTSHHPPWSARTDSFKSSFWYSYNGQSPDPLQWSGLLTISTFPPSFYLYYNVSPHSQSLEHIPICLSTWSLAFLRDPLLTPLVHFHSWLLSCWLSHAEFFHACTSKKFQSNCRNTWYLFFK